MNKEDDKFSRDTVYEILQEFFVVMRNYKDGESPEDYGRRQERAYADAYERLLEWGNQ